MKKFLFLLSVFCTLKASGQDYYITFAGTGESTYVSEVNVENLTTGTSLSLNGVDILHLTTTITGIKSIDNNHSSKIIIQPNPITDNSIIEIYPPVEGDAIITILDFTGRQVARIQSYLENSRQDFQLSGIRNGFYLVNIKGSNYQFSGKLVSNGQSNGTINIEKISSNGNNIVQAIEKEFEKTNSKGTGNVIVDMKYADGDRLKFTGISDAYSTVMMDIPTSDKTITFNFIPCSDCDNNNYSVVKIGLQTWMAENLKTTKLIDCTSIPLITSGLMWWNLTSPGFCWYNQSEADHKDTYGALYNWYTVKTDKLCPQGWHVPNYNEWTALITYLEGESMAGSRLKETGIAHWSKSNNSVTNESGFTALPGGMTTDGFNTPTYRIIGFTGETHAGYWWSSTEDDENFSNSWGRCLNEQDNDITENNLWKKQGLSVRCLKDESQTLPVLTTATIISLTENSATTGGNITNDGNAPITARGVCWSTSENPTIIYSKTNDGTRIGSFTSSITGLTEGITYYVKAYATNIVGTAYGNQIKFNTKIADIEGNTYNTISVGTQIWMAENLKTTKYNNGTTIPHISDNVEWGALATPGYCWYDNDAATYKDQYGALYNWFAINTGQLCPTGWKVPGDSEWTILTDYSGGENIAGGKLKESGTNHWLNPNTGATNETGFTALPGGDRSNIGEFSSIGQDGTWWSSSDDISGNAWYRSMKYNTASAVRNTYYKPNGFSVRCLKEDINMLPTITTTAINNLTQTTATSGGIVINDGNVAVTSRGVCWSTSPNPTTTDNKITSGEGTGDFTCIITGLTSGVTYYVRAYATNDIGTAYGNEVLFATKGETGSVSDIDGNKYSTIVIGNQTWMAENLKTTKYNDGALIPLLSNNDSWSDVAYDGYCWYNHDEAANKETYGALYNLYALDAMRISGKKICPVGWHIPTDVEWTILTDYLSNNGFGNEGNGSDVAKSMAATSVWTTFSKSGTIGNNLADNNSSGFNAIPGGSRGNNGSYYQIKPLFLSINYTGFWWSSTLGPSVQLGSWDKTDCAWTRSLASDFTDVGRYSKYGRDCFSVRCLKGEIALLPIVTTTTIFNITQNSATSGGKITDDGNAVITSRGVCWNEGFPELPTIENNKTNDGIGSGEFTSSITGLVPGKTYHVRAYATNSVGTNYGNEIIFTP